MFNEYYAKFEDDYGVYGDDDDSIELDIDEEVKRHAWNHPTNFIRLMGNSLFFMRSFDVKNWFVEICQ